MQQAKKMEADVVIAGGGPGGCVLANDLAKKGKKVILVEQGGNNTKLFGSPAGPYLGDHMEKAPFPRVWSKTVEGMTLALGKGVGGGTIMYGGFTGTPDIEAFEDIGIDLKPYLEDAKRLSWANETPDEFIGPATRRLWEAGLECGFRWEKVLRHIDFNKCECGCTKCIFGCPRGAKWMGKYEADEAEAHGATLLIYTKVRDVIIENGVAVGLNAKSVKDDQAYEIRCKVVVCAAGAKGSSLILRKSGITDAGNTLSGDVSILAYGFLAKGNDRKVKELGTSIGCFDDERGLYFMGGPAALRSMILFELLRLPPNLKTVISMYRKRNRAFVAAAKIHDDPTGGRILWNGDISKTLTSQDEEKLNYARWAIEKTLIKAGCDPYEIRHSSTMIGHLNASIPIGELVGTNLETQIKNLFVCDLSTIPRAPYRPPVLTIVCLAKYLGPILLKRLS